ncbi:hypothetical protein EMIT0194MI4_10249 [Pseudomonas sp. IT-194MI4]
MSYRPILKVRVCFCKCNKCIELIPFLGEEVRHCFRIALAKLTIITRSEDSLMLEKGGPISARIN